MPYIYLISGKYEKNNRNIYLYAIDSYGFTSIWDHEF